MPNLNDKLVDIETDLEEFPNILQQRKRAFKHKDDTIIQPDHDDSLVKHEKYRKRWEMKGSKSSKRALGWQNRTGERKPHA